MVRLVVGDLCCDVVDDRTLKIDLPTTADTARSSETACQAGGDADAIDGALVELALKVLEIERKIQDCDIEILGRGLSLDGRGSGESRKHAAEACCLHKGATSGLEVDWSFLILSDF